MFIGKNDEEPPAMHVLIIPTERYVTPDSPLGGIFQFHQARALARAGVKTGVIAPAPKSLKDLPRQRRPLRGRIEFREEGGVAVYRNEGWNWISGKIDRFYQQTYDKAGMRLYERYVAERGRPDLIHAHNCLQAGAFAANRLARTGIPLIVTEHSSLYAQGGLGRWQARLAAAAWKTARARLVVTPRLGDLVNGLLGRPDLTWEVVPNILDRPFEESGLDPAPAVRRGPFRFLNIGALIPIKNQALLLGAFTEAFRETTDVELAVGGDGPLRRDLENSAARLGISRQVHFLGYLTRAQVLEEIRRCDAFVLSSDYETFGVVLIEAASCGKPLIATMGSGPESIVTPALGILVPPRDQKSLAAAMVRMRVRISDYNAPAIRRECLDRFGEKAVVDKLVSVYHRILEGEGTP
jgi:teichuronic acid biosynthesis glycosyltransferase TuaC